MTDTTGCLLQIGGIISQHGAEHLAQSFVKHSNLYTAKQAVEALMQGHSDWNFDDVVEGKMNDDMRQALDHLSLDFAWSWNEGETFYPGVTFRRISDQTEDEFLEVDGTICLRVQELSHADRIEAAQQWTLFREDLDLTPFTSQHHLASLISARPELAVYAKDRSI